MDLQILKDLTSEILVSMFYLNPETQPDTIIPKLHYAVSISTDNVEFIMMFCQKTAHMMAENFMGTDDITETDIQDTLKEAINIIIGNYIGQEYPESSVKIPIPVMIKNLNTINIDLYEKIILYYNEEPVQILKKK